MPLQRSGWEDNIARGVPVRGYVACAGFFNLFRFNLAPDRAAPCFMRLTLLGFRLQGVSASDRCAPPGVACPRAVTSRLSSLLRNRREPGRSASGLWAVLNVGPFVSCPKTAHCRSCTLVAFLPLQSAPSCQICSLRHKAAGGPSRTSAYPAFLRPKPQDSRDMPVPQGFVP
jgi:hypothetical protein